MRFARFLAVAMLSSCALFGPSKEDHPRDVETSSVPKTTSGACEGDSAPTLAPSTFFVGPYQPSETRPAFGSIVAFEGTPRANMMCSQRGCEFECCDNGCGAEPECEYVLRDETDQFNEVCLAHPSFACGGSDCSPFCEPFSHAPKQRYRFVGRIEYRENDVKRTPILRIERFCQATQ
jgi:hypothetical protein